MTSAGCSSCALCWQRRRTRAESAHRTGRQSTTAAAAFRALILRQDSSSVMRTSTLQRRCAAHFLFHNACLAVSSSTRISSSAHVALARSGRAQSHAFSTCALPAHVVHATQHDALRSHGLTLCQKVRCSGIVRAVATGGGSRGSGTAGAAGMGAERHAPAPAAAESAAEVHAAACAHHLRVRVDPQRLRMARIAALLTRHVRMPPVLQRAHAAMFTCTVSNYGRACLPILLRTVHMHTLQCKPAKGPPQASCHVAFLPLVCALV